ncbi:hypothetical protein L6V77_09165 [Myxococcota bacterium]|nr:hypothetical protein [Myxococcota bacterium]
MRPSNLSWTLALALVVGPGGPARAREPAPLSLTVHMAEPGAAPEWLAAQVAWANRLMAPAGVAVEVTSTRPLPARHARLMTRADRDALARLRRRGTIDVFIVDHLEDVDEPGRARMGVHWRLRRDRQRRYVILSKTATPTVLAHELGHYFGNGHTDVVDNVMSYARSDPERMHFDEVQSGRIRRAARALVRAGTVRPVTRRPGPQRPAASGAAVGGAAASGGGGGGAASTGTTP